MEEVVVAAPLDILRLGIVQVRVSSMEKAMQFYKGVLGFEEGEQMLAPGITLKAGEISLYISELEVPYEPTVREHGTYPEISLCFIVKGVRAAYERCRDAGVTIVGDYDQPGEHFATVQIADPDRNVIELWGNP